MPVWNWIWFQNWCDEMKFIRFLFSFDDELKKLAQWKNYEWRKSEKFEIDKTDDETNWKRKKFSTLLDCSNWKAIKNFPTFSSIKISSHISLVHSTFISPMNDYTLCITKIVEYPFEILIISFNSSRKFLSHFSHIYTSFAPKTQLNLVIQTLQIFK